MKKLLVIALAIVAGASLNPTQAKGKKDKKQKAVSAVVLATPGDTLSYAAGMSFTNGLMPFLKQQYGVSEAQMPDVIRGFKEAVAHDNDSAFTAYTAGLAIAEMVKQRMLPSMRNDFSEEDNIQDQLVYAGFAASLEKDYSLFTDSAALATFADCRAASVKRQNQKNKEAGEAFLAANKLQPGVVTLQNGLQYKILKKGDGPVPTATDRVRVIYEGRTIDGKVFDATSKHAGKSSDVFGVGGLIKGWTQALLMMPVGSKWELYIPEDLAYGGQGAGRDIQPYSALIFTLELLGIEESDKK